MESKRAKTSFIKFHQFNNHIFFISWCTKTWYTSGHQTVWLGLNILYRLCNNYIDIINNSYYWLRMKLLYDRIVFSTMKEHLSLREMKNNYFLCQLEKWHHTLWNMCPFHDFGLILVSSGQTILSLESFATVFGVRNSPLPFSELVVHYCLT